VSGTHRPTVVGDAHHLPIGSGSIDLVLSFQLLEHCNDPRRTVSEMHRVLAPGGTMVLSTVLLYALHGSPQDYYRFTDVALRDLAHQFDAVTVIPMGNRLTAAYDLVVARSLMLNTLFGRAAARLWGAPSDTCPSGYVMIARKASE
jgi:ubiquinone/menaquinone biosynthesis C-methylase UbiE